MTKVNTPLSSFLPGLSQVVHPWEAIPCPQGIQAAPSILGTFAFTLTPNPVGLV